MINLKDFDKLLLNMFTLPTPPPPVCECIKDILKHTDAQQAKLKVDNSYLQDRAEAAEARVQYYKNKTRRLRNANFELRRHTEVLERREKWWLMRKAADAAGQTKRDSTLEAVVNVWIGYWIAIFSQLLVFPLFGIHVTILDNLLIGLYFTVISLVRSYCLRRYFNLKTVRSS